MFTYRVTTLLSLLALWNMVTAKDIPLKRPTSRFGKDVSADAVFRSKRDSNGSFKLAKGFREGFVTHLSSHRLWLSGKRKGRVFGFRKSDFVAIDIGYLAALPGLLLLARTITDLRCPEPGTPAGATRYGDSLLLGTEVTYSCGPDLVVVGNSTLTCLVDAVWSSAPPRCRRSVFCPEPMWLPNSDKAVIKMVEVDGFGPNDRVVYTCFPGFQLGPVETQQEIRCLQDGTWEKSIPKCSPVHCDSPLHILHGTFSPVKNTYVYNDLITYTCDGGYGTAGMNVMICNKDGAWTDSIPECREHKCPDHFSPEHCRRIGNGFLVGDSVSFVCEEGYILTGSKNRTCQENLKWSGILPICEAEIKDSDCPDPGIPIGATREGHRFMVRDSVTYICGEDFLLEGNATRYCLENGHWSGRETFCRYKYSYDDLHDAASSFKEKINNLAMITKHNEIQMFLRGKHTGGSNNGAGLSSGNPVDLDLLLAVDVSKSISTKSLETVRRFCKEIVNMVGPSGKRNGTRVNVFTFSDGVYGVVHTGDEQPAVSINANIEKLTFKNGGTQGISEVLSEISDHITFSKILMDNVKTQFVVVSLTDGKHNLYGNPTEIANGLVEQGVDMYAIGIGDTINYEMLRNISSSGQFIRLKDMEHLDHIVSKLISAQYKTECGVGGLDGLPASEDLDNHMEAEDIRNWPWVAELYYKPFTQYVLRCGGSIIHNQWLLTAAHCFTESSFDPTKWKVKVGSLKRGLSDGDNNHIFNIQRIIPHPAYSLPPGGHELNDIALIKLQQPLNYTAAIRPICLPKDFNEFLGAEVVDWYADNQDYVVNGWGGVKSQTDDNDNAVFLSDVLKYIIMPKQTDEVCKKSAPKKVNLIYEKMYCAGRGNLDTCEGDSGGPSMKEVRISDRTKKMVQIGVVSFGFGCKQVGRYGYYTRLLDFQDWIYQTIDGATVPQRDVNQR